MEELAECYEQLAWFKDEFKTVRQPSLMSCVGEAEGAGKPSRLEGEVVAK